MAVSDRRKGLDREIFDEIDLKILMAIAREVAVAIENVKLYKELNYLAIMDPLTHVYNFRYFTKTLDYEIERAKRFGGELCLMMLDVDYFKPYNDSFGHLEGDHLLKEVARSLEAHLRHTDILCRYAGDEFVAILPQTDKEGAMIAAEKIRQTIEHLNLRRTVTVSIGIVTFSSEMTRYDMTAKADRALYQAKHDGRNRVCFFG
jgi:diguanylate cyclase (GGDEF)-like protein